MSTIGRVGICFDTASLKGKKKIWHTVVCRVEYKNDEM